MRPGSRASVIEFLLAIGVGAIVALGYRLKTWRTDSAPSWAHLAIAVVAIAAIYVAVRRLTRS